MMFIEVFTKDTNENIAINLTHVTRLRRFTIPGDTRITIIVEISTLHGFTTRECYMSREAAQIVESVIGGRSAASADECEHLKRYKVSTDISKANPDGFADSFWCPECGSFFNWRCPYWVRPERSK